MIHRGSRAFLDGIRGVRQLSFGALYRHCFVAVALLATSTPAWAKPVDTGESPVSGLEVLRVFGGLVLVLAVLLGGLWLLKHFGGGALRTSRGHMRLLSSLPLGNRARLLLVEVREAQLLIGVSAQRVELVARFDAAAGTESSTHTDEAFMERLVHSLRGEQGRNDEGQDCVEDTDRGGDSTQH